MQKNLKETSKKAKSEKKVKVCDVAITGQVLCHAQCCVMQNTEVWVGEPDRTEGKRLYYSAAVVDGNEVSDRSFLQVLPLSFLIPPPLSFLVPPSPVPSFPPPLPCPLISSSSPLSPHFLLLLSPHFLLPCPLISSSPVPSFPPPLSPHFLLPCPLISSSPVPSFPPPLSPHFLLLAPVPSFPPPLSPHFLLPCPLISSSPVPSFPPPLSPHFLLPCPLISSSPVPSFPPPLSSKIHVHDVVSVCPEEAGVSLYIAKVCYMWEDTATGKKLFHGHWFRYCTCPIVHCVPMLYVPVMHCTSVVGQTLS